MKEILKNQISVLHRNSPPSKDLYQALLSKIDFEVDEDFLDFIIEHNGAEGFLCQDYIMFWGIADLIALNPYYEDVVQCQSLFFFGSNGSNYGFAFSKGSRNIVGIDFLEIYDTKPDLIADTFLEFIISTNSRES